MKKRLKKQLRNLVLLIAVTMLVIFNDSVHNFLGSLTSDYEFVGSDVEYAPFEITDNTETSTEFTVPVYSGAAYVYVNNNIPYFTEAEKQNTTAFETYSPLDKLGRCGIAYANICTELLPTEERDDISSVYPSGWVQEKYEGIVDNNWLYNRCHLIAYSLAGENANELNLITGTRYMNIEGMWQMEETVLYYIKDNPDNHVLYRVTPIFEGNNLVASGVLMEAYSVEDNGAGVCFNVYCFNVEPGIEINYATGESKIAD